MFSRTKAGTGVPMSTIDPFLRIRFRGGSTVTLEGYVVYASQELDPPFYSLPSWRGLTGLHLRIVLPFEVRRRAGGDRICRFSRRRAIPFPVQNIR